MKIRIINGYAYGSYITYQSVDDFLKCFTSDWPELICESVEIVFAFVKQDEIDENENGIPIFKCKIKSKGDKIN